MDNTGVPEETRTPENIQEEDMVKDLGILDLTWPEPQRHERWQKTVKSGAAVLPRVHEGGLRQSK